MLLMMVVSMLVGFLHWINFRNEMVSSASRMGDYQGREWVREPTSWAGVLACRPGILMLRLWTLLDFMGVIMAVGLGAFWCFPV